MFRLVSAYFTIYGYEALQSELRGVKDVRFLFGDPASVGELDPRRESAKSLQPDEDGLAPQYTLRQKYLARQCEAWGTQQRRQNRSIGQSNFLHGKMYLTESAHGGHSGGRQLQLHSRRLGQRDECECGNQLGNPNAGTCAELQQWFDDLWADGTLTKDVKRMLLDALARIGRDYALESIYYKTLYELFQEDIEARKLAKASKRYAPVRYRDLECAVRLPKRRS